MVGEAGTPGIEPPALEVDHISAAYGPYRALFDVTFTVPARSITALLGSNGAGKSTVARVVSGLLPSTHGAIRLSGHEVTGQPAYKIARAGMAHVPEGRGIFANLTVEENLVMAFRQRAGRRRVPESLDRAYQAFPVLGQRRKQAGGTLSGGQQRLLSLAGLAPLAAPRPLARRNADRRFGWVERGHCPGLVHRSRWATTALAGVGGHRIDIALGPVANLTRWSVSVGSVAG